MASSTSTQATRIDLTKAQYAIWLKTKIDEEAKNGSVINTLNLSYKNGGVVININDQASSESTAIGKSITALEANFVTWFVQQVSNIKFAMAQGDIDTCIFDYSRAENDVGITLNFVK
ncbi:hypothetical protein KTN00_12160 [Acinetobacter soli]|uniref:hypothetical protein n=1 Tax=Acinetobacter soli TaxID=487316 RepID=UPI001C44ED72|nr:hypothetical protein [Acinetobacter soli]MBV6551769.1 hypothetical protein [Acinetobacter soli]